MNSRMPPGWSPAIVKYINHNPVVILHNAVSSKIDPIDNTVLKWESVIPIQDSDGQWILRLHRSTLDHALRDTELQVTSLLIQGRFGHSSVSPRRPWWKFWIPAKTRDTGWVP